jgi:aminocarboxymuconate-semialdehyde decarboxylase
MKTRREFLSQFAAATGLVFMPELKLGPTPRRLAASAVVAQQAAARRREVVVGGRRVRTVDGHAHTFVPTVAEVVKGSELEKSVAGSLAGALVMSDARIRAMDEQGIDIEVLSINPYWYGVDRQLAERLIAVQNEGLAALCAVRPGNSLRFVALATVALQHPELAVEQLEDAFKRHSMRGVSLGASVAGEELASPRFDPFWAKAEQLGALIFIHPQGVPQLASRLQGNGFLTNVIGNPLETTIALSHLIFEGTMDRFPALKICAAHAGGFMPSYNGRFDQGCVAFPANCNRTLKRKPSEYLKQMYFDSMVFSGEGLRHLVAEYGAGHIVLGTDYPFPWTTTAVDHVMGAPGLTNADRVAILGDNLSTLLRIPSRSA